MSVESHHHIQWLWLVDAGLFGKYLLHELIML
jgi:hypothetical protein